ncbi:hypothetical protein [Candidatus Contubernalis alkaliaceticus]|uniref:hypothetical protein n=1 Tax=Candidatus Contubernalis alkaliaceticus TaxID=338645 RepID=UPI001F4C2F78|nr:hypothetical protein [Candidatus Contubernalis alkalaceticus]UNC91652.1 hypothetical protein HUE98_05835 [Candidatus Contubernalis alkalaceticus]
MSVLLGLNWLFEGLVTAILVFGLTAYWDWRNNKRHYQNLFRVLMEELQTNYQAIVLIEKDIFDQSHSFNTTVWKTVKYELAKYCKKDLFGLLVKTYEHLESWKLQHDILCPHFSQIREQSIMSLKLLLRTSLVHLSRAGKAEQFLDLDEEGILGQIPPCDHAKQCNKDDSKCNA